MIYILQAYRLQSKDAEEGQAPSWMGLANGEELLAYNRLWAYTVTSWDLCLLTPASHHPKANKKKMQTLLNIPQG